MLMILDGNSIVNRAYYGIRPLSAPDGTPTNAIYGFLNILHKLIKEYCPDSLCVSFDVHAPTFRHVSCEFYKAQRKPMPEDLRVQIPILKDILNKMGISIVEKEGYEADDVLGTISKNCEKSNVKCIVVTGDRDSLQLVSEFTSVCLVRNNENTLYTPDVFKEEYGFEPCRIVDLKALMGDSSDNIPGVPGIGEKTAKELISKYFSVESIYNNIDSIEIKDSVRNKLKSGKDSAYTSLWLATIFRDIPLSMSVSDLKWDGSYQDGLYSVLNNLGLNRTIQMYKIPSEPNDQLVFEPEANNDSIPDGLTVTTNLKQLYKEGFDGLAFDTTIAQYLINPTAKEYSDKASYSLLNNKLKELHLENLYYNIELPLAKVLASMESNGISVDKNMLKEFSIILGDSINQLQNNIFFQCGKEFNINSTKQLGEVLFDELKLPDKKKRSTAADVLDSLRSYHPIINDILEYRELSKLKSTYADGLQEFIQPDGKIHTSFQQTVTATGRLSSIEPNLQNIPIRKELGSQLRKMFISSEGNVLIDADYSQIELRLLANISNDKEMIEAFNSGEDFHKVTASRVFNIPLNNVTSLERSRAKAVNFGIIYGMSAFSLANEINVSRQEAQLYIDSYFNKFSDVDLYLKDVVKKAYIDGYVTTLYGRRRELPELKSSNYNMRQFGERVALNMPIQGTAADIIKLAMIRAYNELKGTSAKLILQVHDELIVECSENDKDLVSRVLKESMESVVDMKVPLVVDIGIGTNWAEAH